PTLNAIAPGGTADARALERSVEQDRSYMQNLAQATEAFIAINPAHKALVGQTLPIHADIPGIFIEDDAIARKNGMALVSIDTTVDETTISPEGLKTVRVSANVTGGSYEQIKRFLNDLETSVRIADVQTISFAQGASAYGVTYKTYFLAQPGIPAQ